MKLYKTKISLLAILTILCVFALALTLVTDANTVVRAEGEVAQPTIASVTFDGEGLTVTSNIASKSFIYDNTTHNLAVNVTEIEGITLAYSWYFRQVIPARPGDSPNTGTSLGLPPFLTGSYLEQSTDFEKLSANSNTISLTDVVDSGDYYCVVTATDGTTSLETIALIDIEIGRANADITLSQSEITYTDNLEIDLVDYITVAGGGSWTATVTKSADVAFDYDGTTKTISNITKAGGTFTVIVDAELSADDNYNAGQKELTVTLNKGAQNVTILPPAGVEAFLVQTPYVFTLDGVKTSNPTLTVSAKGEGVACSNNGGGSFTVTDRGVDGMVTLSASALGNDLYEAGEATYTFYAQKKPSDKPYSTPSDLTVASGSPLSTVTFADPTKYSWRDPSQVFNGAGERTAIALFTSAPDNYTPVEVELTVTVLHGSHAVCGMVGCAHEGHSSAEYTVLNSALYTTWNSDGATYPTYEIPSGNYVLTETLSVRLKVPKDNTVTICLAGNTITSQTFNNLGTLNICDCSMDHSGKVNVTGTWGLQCGGASSILNLYSGTIEYALEASQSNTRRGVYLADTTATFNMYGGRVVSLNRYVYAIYNRGEGIVRIFGGEVISKKETAILSYGSIEISGGTISAPTTTVDYSVEAIRILGASSSSSVTVAISGGCIDGQISLYPAGRLEIVGSGEIPIGGILMTALGKNSENDYRLDLSGYSGPSQYTIAPYPNSESIVASNAIVAKGGAQNLLLDSSASCLVGWALFEDNGEIKLTHLAHDSNTPATCKSGAICSICGDAHGDVDPTNHSSNTTKLSPNADGTTHNVVLDCCSAIVEENIPCAIKSGSSTSCDKDKVCDCGQVLVASKPHTYDGYIGYADYHYQECTVCQYTTNTEDHVYDDENDEFCNICGSQKAIGYNIYVGQTEVTSLNKDDVLGEADQGATVTYNPETNVLTLDNANISVNWYMGIETYDSVTNSPCKLNLHLVGANVLLVYGYMESYGIYAESISITADEGATLSVTVDDKVDDEYMTMGLVAEFIYVESGTVTVSGEYMAIGAGNLTASIRGSAEFGATTLTNATYDSNDGVMVDGQIAKTVELTPTYNLFVNGVVVSANNAGDIFADANSNNGVPTAKYDLATNTLTLTNANLTTAGAEGIIEALSADGAMVFNLKLHLVGQNVITSQAQSAFGILARNLTITADEGASLTMDGVEYGIGSYGNKLEIMGGALTINATGYGISASEGGIEISGGEVRINAELAIMINSEGAIVADKHVIVGSATLGATDLTLATVAYFEGATLVFIGQPDGETVAKTVHIYPHVHAWSEQWSTSDTHHWHECTALGCYLTDNALKGGYATHAPENDDGNCATAESCICGMEVVSTSSHVYENDCDPTCNNCTFIRNVTHAPNDDDGDCTTPITCSLCGVVTTVGKTQHLYENDCDPTCNNTGCTHTREITHIPNDDDGDCQTAIYCSLCNAVTTPAQTHGYDNACDTTCNNAGCTAGNRTIFHNGVKTDKVEPDHHNTGKQAYWTCSVCGKHFSDEACVAQIDDLATYGVIAKVDHSFDSAWKADNNEHWRECSCGDKQEVGSHVYDQKVATDVYKKQDVTCNDVYYKSCVCGRAGTETFTNGEHHTGTATKLVCNEDGTHDILYTCCDAVASDNVTCTASNADSNCTTAETCVCGYVVATAKTHVLAIKTDKNDTHHVLECTNAGCDHEEDASHTFDKEVANASNKVADATCVAKAIYYKSCACGHQGNATFEYGQVDADSHSGTATTFVTNNDGTHDVKYTCCGAVALDDVPCSGGSASCTDKALCEHCQVAYGNTVAHQFTIWAGDDNQHWKKCASCDATDTKQNHDGSASCTSKAHCSVCDVYYGETDGSNHVKDTFVYVDNGEGAHAKKNECCNAVVANEQHTFTDGKCICGASEEHTHKHSAEWIKTDTHHWRECSCGDRAEYKEHSFETEGKCVCGASKPVTPTYTIVVENGTINGETTVVVEQNGSATVVANSAPQGQRFKGWSVKGEIVSTATTYTFTATENVTITAVFEAVTEPPTNPPKDDGLSTGAIVGIISGSVVGLGGIAFAILWFIKKKK